MLVGGLLIAAIVALVLVGLLAVSLGPPGDREVARLVDVLELRGGMAVGEIGAGAGALTIAVARRVGPTGHVFSTELNADRLDQIRAAVAEAGLANVTEGREAGRARGPASTRSSSLGRFSEVSGVVG